MFDTVAEGIRRTVVSLIKVTFLLTVLIAFIAWARNNPEVAQKMLTIIANTVASVVTWACQHVIDWTDGRPST